MNENRFTSSNLAYSIVSSHGPQIKIINSLSGTCISVNPYNFPTIESLKTSIGEKFSIPSASLFMITPLGVKVKMSSLHETDQVFVFDRRSFSSHHAIDDFSLHQPIKPMESPMGQEADNAFDRRDSRGVLNVLKRNSAWASAILSDFKQMSEDQAKNKVQNMLSGISALIQYSDMSLRQSAKTVDQKTVAVAKLKETSLSDTWKEDFSLLKKLSFPVEKHKQSIVLAELVSAKELTHWSDLSKGAQMQLDETIGELHSEMELIKKVSTSLNERLKRAEEDFSWSTIDLSELERLTKLLVNVPSEPQAVLEKYSIAKQTAAHFSEKADSVYQQQVARSAGQKDLLDFISKEMVPKVAAVQKRLLHCNDTFTEIDSTMESIKSIEHKICIVRDLPQLVGLLSLELRRQCKWFDSCQKIVWRTNEVWDKMRFDECEFRKEWMVSMGGLIDHDLEGFLVKNKMVKENHEDSKRRSMFSSFSSPSWFERLSECTVGDFVNYLKQLENAGVDEKIVSRLRYGSEEQRDTFDFMFNGFMKGLGTEPEVSGYVQRIKKLENLLHNQSIHLAKGDLKDEVSERESALLKRERDLKEKEDTVKSRELSVLGKEDEVKRIESSTTRREKVLQERETSLSENKTEQERFFSEKQAKLNKREASLDHKQSLLDGKESSLNEKEKALYDREMSLHKEEKILHQKETSLGKNEASFLERETSCNEKEIKLMEQQTVLAEKEKFFLSNKKSFFEKATSTETLSSKLSEGKSRESIESELFSRTNELSLLQTELNQQKDRFHLTIHQQSLALYQALVFVCIVLENVGLLLTKESGSFKVVRVKGLKTNKTSLVNDTINSCDVKSPVAKEVEKLIPDDNFWKVVQPDYQVILDGITRRFKDLETLARKLQKENGVIKKQLERAVKDCQGKVSIKNFQPNDLILFLPTSDEMQNKPDSLEQPWAAFNIGAPHFFLKNEPALSSGDPNPGYINLVGRDWAIARATKVEEHNDANPFMLGQGSVWFYIEADEVKVM